MLGIIDRGEFAKKTQDPQQNEGLVNDNDVNQRSGLPGSGSRA